MPKVEYTAAKGLVQSAGSGVTTVVTTNISTQNLMKDTQGCQLQWRLISEDITLANSTTTSQGAAAFVPAGFICFGGEMRISTAGTIANAAPDKVGDGSDANFYGGITLDTTDAAGTTVLLTPTALIPPTSAARLTVTHASVTQTIVAIVTVKLWGLVPVKS
jgi:hypothetical protein